MGSLTGHPREVASATVVGGSWLRGSGYRRDDVRRATPPE